MTSYLETDQRNHFSLKKKKKEIYILIYGEIEYTRARSSEISRNHVLIVTANEICVIAFSP